MSVLRAIGFLFIVLLSTGSTIPPLAPAEIVRRHIEAIGGSARWDSVQALLIRGSSSYGSFTWVWKKPDRMRSEERDVLYSGRTLITAYDGTTGWIVDPFKGPSTPRRLDRFELQRWQTGFPGRSELLDLPDHGVDLKLIGSERVHDRDAWKLSLNRPGRDEIFLWIDAQSYFLVQRARKLKTPWGKEEVVATPLGDYRNVHGLLIPHAIGTTRCSVEVNPEVGDSLFQPPQPLP